MATNKNPVQLVANLLAETLEEIQELLKAPEHNVILLGVDADLKRTVSRLHHLSGIAMPINGKEEFPPITSFLGDPIQTTAPGPLTDKDLDPEEETFLRLKNRAERLYAEITTMSIEAILSTFTIPEEQLVLRGVAKMAGIEDYKEREIDADFVEDIIEAIQGKAQEAQRIAEENAKLEKQDRIVKLQDRITEVTLKRSVLDVDLTEASKAFAENTDGRKTAKLQKDVTNISEEITAADELLTNLTKELEDLLA